MRRRFAAAPLLLTGVLTSAESTDICTVTSKEEVRLIKRKKQKREGLKKKKFGCRGGCFAVGFVVRCLGRGV